LAKKPDARFASAQDFARALDPCRVARDLEPARWKVLLEQPAVAAQAEDPASAATAGSTQNRLDEQFVMGTTPAHAPATPAANPGPQLVAVPHEEAARQEEERRQALAAAVQSIEEALARRDLQQAETRLYAAEADFGEQPALRSLHVQLAALR